MSAGDTRFVDVSYRGLRVAQRAKLSESGPTAGFVEVEAPLPVGTHVSLAAEGGFAVEATVMQVVEQEAGAKSPPGMRVEWAAAIEAHEKKEPAPAAEAEADDAGEEPAPTDGKRKRRRQKTIIGRPQ